MAKKEIEIDPGSLKMDTGELLNRMAVAQAWSDYVTNVSAPEWAISLELADWLDAYVREAQPRTVLDAGSGLSSWVLSRACEEGTVIHSVDDDADFLAKSEQYCSARDGHDFMLLGEWLGRESSYDLVVYDLKGSLRPAYLRRMLDRVAPGGVVVFDDLHRFSYRRQVEHECSMRGWDYRSLEHCTVDKYGRYAGLGRAPSK